MKTRRHIFNSLCIIILIFLAFPAFSYPDFGDIKWYSLGSANPVSPTWTLVSQNSTSITYNLEIQGVNYYEVGKEFRFFIEGTESMDQSGLPEIPFFKDITFLPWASSHSISITVLDADTVTVLPPLYPIPIELFSDETSWYETYTKNYKAYEKNSFYPSNNAVFLSEGTLQEQSLGSFAVSPVKYNPATNEYIFLKDINITITSSGVTSARLMDHTGMETSYMGPLLQMVQTPVVDPLPAEIDMPVIFYPDTIPSYCDMIVVTGPPFIQNGVPSQELSEYLTYRSWASGLDIVVIEETPYVSRLAIRQDIYDVYTTYNDRNGDLPNYLLIIGDDDIIRATGDWCNLLPGHFCNYSLDDGGDAYYTKLTYENNGVMTFVPEDMDELALDFGDLQYGRIPAINLDQLALYYHKASSTEQFYGINNYKKNLTLLNTDVTNISFPVAKWAFRPRYLHDIDLDNIYALDSSIHPADSLSYLSPVPAVTTANPNIPYGATPENERSYSFINRVFLGGFYYNGALRTPSPIVYQASHGMDGGRGWTGMCRWDPVTSYYATEEYLEKYYPLVITSSCFGGNYDVSLAEMNGPYTNLFLVNDYGANTEGSPYGGAVAILGTTRLNATGVNGPYGSTLRDYYDTNTFTLGEFTACLNSYRNFWRNYNNLLGDPALQLVYSQRGPMIVSDDTVLDGNYLITRDIKVRDNALLTIAAGSKLTFTPGSRLEILDGARIMIEGTVTDSVELCGTIGHYRDSWEGIWIGSDAGQTNCIEYAKIRNAEYGVRNRGTDTQVYIDNSTIDLCEYGVYNYGAAKWLQVRDSEISNCLYGFYSTSTRATNWFSLKNSLVRDSYYHGVQFSSVYKAYVLGTRILDSGYSGLRITNTDIAYLTKQTSNDYPVIISGNGHSANANPSLHPAFYTSGTYYDYYNNVHVYNNELGGIKIMSGVSYNSSYTYNINNEIVSNTLSLDGTSSNSVRYELYDYYKSLDMDERNYNLFNEKETDRPPVYIRYYTSVYFDDSDIWWGEDITNVTQVLNHIYCSGNIVPGALMLASSRHYMNDNGDYPGISSFTESEFQQLIDRGIAALDTGGNIDLAIQSFTEAARTGSPKALHLLAASMRIANACDQDQMKQQLTLCSDDIIADFEAALAYAGSFIHEGKYSKGIQAYLDFAANTTRPDQKLHAILSAADAARLVLQDGDELGGTCGEFRFNENTYNLEGLIELAGQAEAQLDNDDILSDSATIPDDFSLTSCYPNPFNPAVNIRFTVPETHHIKIEAFDTLGRCVATITRRNYSAGKHTIQWDAGEFASGVYFIRMDAGTFQTTRKVVLMK